MKQYAARRRERLPAWWEGNAANDALMVNQGDLIEIGGRHTHPKALKGRLRLGQDISS